MSFQNPYFSGMGMGMMPQYPQPAQLAPQSQVVKVNGENGARAYQIGANYNTTVQIQKVLDAIAGNRMADMQNQINQLQLQNAMTGVMRFPNAWTFNGGVFPPVTPAAAA